MPIESTADFSFAIVTKSCPSSGARSARVHAPVRFGAASRQETAAFACARNIWQTLATKRDFLGQLPAQNVLKSLHNLSKGESVPEGDPSFLINHWETQPRVQIEMEFRNTKGYSSTYLAMGCANVRAGTRYPPEH